MDFPDFNLLFKNPNPFISCIKLPFSNHLFSRKYQPTIISEYSDEKTLLGQACEFSGSSFGVHFFPFWCPCLYDISSAKKHWLGWFFFQNLSKGSGTSCHLLFFYLSICKSERSCLYTLFYILSSM